MVTDVQKGPTLSIWLRCPIIQTVEKPVLSCLETALTDYRQQGKKAHLW